MTALKTFTEKGKFMNQKDKKEQKELINHQIDRAFLEISNASCPSECTGLVYRPAQNEAEKESYNDIYHFLPGKASLTKSSERKKQVDK